MENDLFAWAKERGYRVGSSSTALLETVKEKLEIRKSLGEIEADFFRKNLDFFRYLEGCSVDKARSLVVVAVPRPAHAIDFEFPERRARFILPPTYVNYRRVFDEVLDDFRASVAGEKWQAGLVSAPLKSLAAHLGLASYGKNNLAYIPEFGSYFQLVGLVTDIPLTKENKDLEGKELMSKACASCEACLQSCPLDAIREERFLLYAERCYVSYSESADPFPSGMVSPSPDCLIGCLECQKVCPMNKGRLESQDTHISFTLEETETILRNTLTDSSPVGRDVREKFESLKLTENDQIFCRNLRHLLKKQ